MSKMRVRQILMCFFATQVIQAVAVIRSSEIVRSDEQIRTDMVQPHTAQPGAASSEYEHARTALENIADFLKFGNMTLLQLRNLSHPKTNLCNQGKHCSKLANPIKGETVAGLVSTVLAGGATPEVIETVSTVVGHLETGALAKIVEDHNDAQKKVNADLEDLKNATKDAVDKWNDAVDRDTAWLACVAEERSLLQAEETCRITEEAFLQEKLVKCNLSSNLSAFQDSSPRPNLSFSCDFESADCARSLSNLKQTFLSWFDTLSTKVEQEQETYIGATQACDTATDNYQHKVSECNGKQLVFLNKKQLCERKQVTRTVAFCVFGDKLQAKCKAKHVYDNTIDWIDGNGTVYSDPERRNEWKAVSTTVCMLNKFKAAGTFTKAEMISCENSSDYDTSVGTLNKNDAVYQRLIAQENFTCSETRITFNGSLWTVPDGENTTSSQYTYAPHSFPVNTSDGSQAFAFCNESDAEATPAPTQPEPKPEPEPEPTTTPTEVPTESLTTSPTNAPSEALTESPTEAPTQAPTEAPTESPTSSPTDAPTEVPTSLPTNAPTEAPTKSPTEAPTQGPTEATEAPTESPTSSPTQAPTEAPTESPTSSPTNAPTQAPTEEPTELPTEDPTESPTEDPTESPTETPPTPSPTPSPTQVTVVDKGADGCSTSSPCGQCEGDCDSDSDCAQNLKCFQRTSSIQVVPGCATTGYVKSASDHDYCYEVPVVDKGADGCSTSSPCGQCEGDCDSDSDCAQNLKCFQRTSSIQVVPGCATTGYVKSASDHDYCYEAPTEAPTESPTSSPTNAPTQADGQFIKGPLNTHACPIGYSHITMFARCKEAGLALGFSYYGTFTSSEFPGRCALSTRNNQVSFSYNEAGVIASYASPVCEKAGIVLGDKGSNVCPDGSIEFTELECSLLGSLSYSELRDGYSGSGSYSHAGSYNADPIGCMTGGTNYYFNRLLSSTPAVNEFKICKPVPTPVPRA